MFVSVWILDYGIASLTDVCFSTYLWKTRYSISFSLDVCFSIVVVGLWYSISLVMFVSVPILPFHEIFRILISLYHPFFFRLDHNVEHGRTIFTKYRNRNENN